MLLVTCIQDQTEAMQKEELGMDENRNPEEELRLLGGKKEKCHNLSNRIRTGNSGKL